MKEWLIALAFVAASLLPAGCGGPDAEALEAQIQAELAKHMDIVDRKNEVLEDRMVLLSRENQQLSDKLDEVLAELKNPGDLTNQVADILEMQVEELIEEQLAAKIGDDPVASVSSQSIRTEIAAYEAEQEAAREAEREAERERRRVEEEKRRQERFASMVETLGLNQQQVDQLTVAQETMQESMAGLLTQMREGTFEGDRREAFMGLREAHETIVKEFMSEEQAKTYLERYSRGLSYGFRGPTASAIGGRPGGGGRGPGGGGRR